MYYLSSEWGEISNTTSVILIQTISFWTCSVEVLYVPVATVKSVKLNADGEWTRIHSVLSIALQHSGVVGLFRTSPD